MNKKAFTLAEVIAVVAILGLLLLLIAPAVINQIKSKNQDIDSVQKQMIKQAANLYLSDHQEDYPNTNHCISTKTLIDEGKLTEEYVNSKGKSEKLNDSLKSVKITIAENGTKNYSFYTQNNCQSQYSPSNILIPKIDSTEVSECDGNLEEDSIEAGRYIYKGNNPCNYIKLGSDLYRIIAIEKDGSLKVITNSSIGNKSFDAGDEVDLTPSVSQKDDQKTYTIKNKIYLADCSGGHGVPSPNLTNFISAWLQTPDLNTFLNQEWYEQLDSNITKYIIDNTWYVGALSNTNAQTIIQDTNQEKSQTWQGKIGLINVTDFIKASNNSECNSVHDYTTSTIKNKCESNNSNYLLKTMWAINPDADNSARVWMINSCSGEVYSNYPYYSYAVYPTFYLSSDLELTSAKGTQTDPYKVKE